MDFKFEFELESRFLQASADRAPPLLEVAAAFAASPALLPLLADRPSQQGSHAMDAEQLPSLLQRSSKESWAKETSGSRLATAFRSCL